jgi:Cu(I)/Ag(I) efflux system membrane fusion protein
MKYALALIVIASLAALPAAGGEGCCGSKTAAKPATHVNCGASGQSDSCGHAGHATTASKSTPTDSRQQLKLSQPAQAVFSGYLKAQSLLAKDTLEGVRGVATEMAEAIRSDAQKSFPSAVSEHAEALARAENLEAARAAYKALSESLIGYLKEQKAAIGSYYVVYCPMAKASWVQTHKTVINPYMGMSMIHCGSIKT